MKSKNLLIIALVIGLLPNLTYAVTALWGDIDEPVTDVLQQQNLDVTQAPPVPQKTMCELLTQKTELGPDALGSTKMQDQIRALANTAKPEYQPLFTKPDAIKELYRQYREQYLLVNCKK